MTTKRWVLGLASLLGAIAAGALWVTSCTGPKPVVASVRLEAPPGEDAPYRVEATVRNTWRGHGPVTVVARLRDAAGGRVLERQEEVTLGGGQTVLVVVEIPAPPGSYRPEAEVEYPPP
jgi:uncharacterized protein (DUF58 family)